MGKTDSTSSGNRKNVGMQAIFIGFSMGLSKSPWCTPPAGVFPNNNGCELGWVVDTTIAMDKHQRSNNYGLQAVSVVAIWLQKVCELTLPRGVTDRGLTTLQEWLSVGI